MKFEIHRHTNQIPAEVATENEERKLKRWYDPRIRGTVAYRMLSMIMAGSVALVVGDKLIDSAKDDMDSVFASRTQQIRNDLQKPMQDVEEARSVIESIETDVGELKQWLENNLGVDFEAKEPKD